MDVAGQESGLESTSKSVDDDAERDQEAGGIQVHAGERVHHGGTAQQKHGGDDDVGHEAEEEERHVSSKSPSGSHYLADCMRCWCLPLDLDRQNAEQQHLDCRTASIPEGTTHPILPCDIGALQYRSSPCPLPQQLQRQPSTEKPQYLLIHVQLVIFFGWSRILVQTAGRDSIMIHGSYSRVSRKKAKSLGNVQSSWWVMICCRELSAKKLLDMYLRNNDTGDETGLDVASGSVEPFGVVSGANISLLQPHLQCQNQLNFSLSVPRSSFFCMY